MIIKSKNIRIESGKNDNTQTINFSKDGYNVLGVMFKKIAGDDDKNVQIRLSNNNHELVPFVNVHFLDKSTDGFKVSTAMPLPPKTLSSDNITIELKADAALTADWKGQLVFLLEQGKVLTASGNIISEIEHESNCKLP